jgi:hypothetical protein
MDTVDLTKPWLLREKLVLITQDIMLQDREAWVL